MGGVMFVSGGGISFSGFLFVSVETVNLFVKWKLGAQKYSSCAILLYLCARNNLKKI